MFMSYHNGPSGCATCEEEGCTVAKGKGHRKAYPYRAETPNMRTSKSIITDAVSASRTNKRVNCFLNLTPLAKLYWFNLSLGIVPDYMHGVLIGMTKQLLNIWLSGNSYKEPWFIGHKVKSIDKCLKEMKPPEYVQRLPRSLETNKSYLKATELQNF
jgi:hypothetical protein